MNAIQVIQCLDIILQFFLCFMQISFAYGFVLFFILWFGFGILFGFMLYFLCDVCTMIGVRVDLITHNNLNYGCYPF